MQWARSGLALSAFVWVCSGLLWVWIWSGLVRLGLLLSGLVLSCLVRLGLVLVWCVWSGASGSGLVRLGLAQAVHRSCHYTMDSVRSGLVLSAFVWSGLIWVCSDLLWVWIWSRLERLGLVLSGLVRLGLVLVFCVWPGASFVMPLTCTSCVMLTF